MVMEERSSPPPPDVAVVSGNLQQARCIGPSTSRQRSSIGRIAFFSFGCDGFSVYGGSPSDSSVFTKHVSAGSMVLSWLHDQPIDRLGLATIGV